MSLFNFQSAQGVEDAILRDALLPLWNDRVEVCGLVLKDSTIYTVRNVHDRPKSGFAFSIEDLDKFLNVRDFNEIAGVFHTHPTNFPAPSKEDLAGKPAHSELRNYIVTQNHVVEWRLSDSGAFSARSF